MHLALPIRCAALGLALLLASPRPAAAQAEVAAPTPAPTPWAEAPVEAYTARGTTFTYTADYARLSVTLKASAGLRSAALGQLKASLKDHGPLQAQLRRLAQACRLEAAEVQFSSRDDSRSLYLDLVPEAAGAKLSPEAGRAVLEALRAHPAVAAAYPSYTTAGETVYLTGRMLASVEGRHSVLPAALQAEVDARGGRVARVYDLRRHTVFAIDYPGSHPMFAEARALNARPELEYATPDVAFTAYSPGHIERNARARDDQPAAAALTTHTPNDPEQASQGFLNNPEDADIDAHEAWAITQGSANVYVVIMDVGFDISHEDVADKVTFPFAYDAVTSSNSPTPENANANHGTPCMGLVAASTNNMTGVAGVGYRVRPFPLNFGANPQSNGSFSSSRDIILNGATYVISNGENVAAVSCSFSLGSANASDPIVIDAFDDMRTQCRNGKGAVILASTGNNSVQRPDITMNAPAVFPYVVGVGATDNFDTKASFSNWGDSLDISAPGTTGSATTPFVYTLDRTGASGYNSLGPSANNNYTRFSGTSAACPVAAGVVGLIASVNPNLTEGRIRRVLLQSADKIAGVLYDTNREFGGWNEFYGYGRVNAHRAVQAAGVTLSAEEQAGALSRTLTVAPNPVRDVIEIRGELPGSGRLRTMLTDAAGRSVRLHDQAAAGSVELRLNVADLPPGIYVLNASFGEARGQWKVVKQ